MLFKSHSPIADVLEKGWESFFGEKRVNLYTILIK